MKRVTFAPEVHDELVEAALFYEARERGLGERFLRGVRRRFSQLGSVRLRRFEFANRPDIRICDIGKPWPYRVVVLENEEERHVLALSHHSRDPMYWLSRLDGE